MINLQLIINVGRCWRFVKYFNFYSFIHIIPYRKSFFMFTVFKKLYIAKTENQNLFKIKKKISN